MYLQAAASTTVVRERMEAAASSRPSLRINTIAGYSRWGEGRLSKVLNVLQSKCPERVLRNQAGCGQCAKSVGEESVDAKGRGR